jgi:hypothetical protein
MTLFDYAPQPSCIDTESAPGAWARELVSPCSYRTVLDDRLTQLGRELDARLALRKAARLEPNPHRRGHITRGINGGRHGDYAGK